MSCILALVNAGSTRMPVLSNLFKWNAPTNPEDPYYNTIFGVSVAKLQVVWSAFIALFCTYGLSTTYSSENPYFMSAVIIITLSTIVASWNRNFYFTKMIGFLLLGICCFYRTTYYLWHGFAEMSSNCQFLQKLANDRIVSEELCTGFVMVLYKYSFFSFLLALYSTYELSTAIRAYQYSGLERKNK